MGRTECTILGGFAGAIFSVLLTYFLVWLVVQLNPSANQGPIPIVCAFPLTFLVSVAGGALLGYRYGSDGTS